MEYKYTRITPDGEEKCSLLDGDGMTREEKEEVINNFCAEYDSDETEACEGCPIHKFGYCTILDCEWTDDMVDKAYAAIAKPPVNFVKANPDDEIDSEVDAVESGLADSGTRREFASGAVRDVAEGKGRCDLLPAVAILRLARHFERGAIKYSDRNWEKGIPIHSFIDSAIRHTMKYLDGQHDEDHLCAAAWNLICAMWTEEKHPELNDLPWAKEANNDH